MKLKCISDQSLVNTIRDKDVDGAVQFNWRFQGRSWVKEWGKCCCRPSWHRPRSGKIIHHHHHHHHYHHHHPLSSSNQHTVGPPVDPFKSHTSTSLFNVLPSFLLPFGLQFFVILGKFLRDILFICREQILLQSWCGKMNVFNKNINFYKYKYFNC